MTEREWSKEWPTEPGHYWFHGFRYGGAMREKESRTYLVSVRMAANGPALYIVDGGFMFSAEGGDGLWCCAEIPVPPTKERGES